MSTTAAAGAKREALGWLDDPIVHYGRSVTQAHSVPRREIEDIQLAALNLRFEQRREQIAMLRKLADAQGITGFADLNDVLPLLFEHTMYKSYPTMLLSKQRFDRLTEWLAKLSTADLSGVDTSRCQSIDDWLAALQEQSPLDVTHSSGTSGTMSFVPRSKADYRFAAWNMRMHMLQRFGAPPSAFALHDKIHVVFPGFRRGNAASARFGYYYKELIAQGDDAFFHTAYDGSISADVMWLAGKLRAAAAKGDISRIDVPENLLARRPELERMQAEMAGQQIRFIQTVVRELRGKRVFATGQSHVYLEVARAGLERGERAEFAPGSAFGSGGGGKGIVLPDDWKNTVAGFFGVPEILMFYGMSEINTYLMTCEQGRHHIAPWLIVYLLNPETSVPLPRSGVQTGRAAFFDVSMQGLWGGLISGDKVTVDWDTQCACGRTTAHLSSRIERYSELQGGGDKINCAGSRAAHGEAMDYLVSLNA
jgi:hypothetical protein